MICFFNSREEFFNYARQFEGFVVPELPLQQEIEWKNGAGFEGCISDTARYKSINVLIDSLQNEKNNENQKKGSKKKVPKWITFKLYKKVGKNTMKSEN